MNITERVKEEVLANFSQSPCCKQAKLSAFIKSVGTLTVNNGQLGFSFYSDNKNVFNDILGDVKSLYGVIPKVETTLKRQKAEYNTEKAEEILSFLSVLEPSQDGLNINLDIDKYLVENQCCKLSFIKGVFLATGNITIPDEQSKQGYLLEFNFSNYVYASCFCELLSDFDVIPKMTERNGYIVYFNNVKDILEILNLLDSVKGRVYLLDVYKGRAYRNQINREMNCTMSNINKQVNAYIKQKEAIYVIKNTIGLDALKKELKQTSLARLNNPESNLEDLASILKISKSCLNHRLRKIVDIASNLTE